MVNPQTGDLPFPDEFEYQSVGIIKNLGVFHPDSSDIVNVEKTPVIDLFHRDAPVGQPPYLFTEKSVQQVKALRVSFDAVKYPDILVNKGSYFRTLIAEDE